MDEGLLDEAQADEMDQKAKAEANAAVKFAEESPYPETEDIFRDIYWEVDNQTDSARHGTYFFNH
jgi:pyruvate dehydrogenase E1 component alpha subunit